MKSWDEVSKEMQLHGVPLSMMGYCKIAFDLSQPTLKWNSDLPTQEGLYRLKTSEAQMSAEICDLGMDELYIQYMGLDGFHKLSDARKDIEWYGPIEPPQYP